jgi:hypothetical protein
VAQLHGYLEVVLPVVPLLLLLLSLLCGIYPGSETIARIIERRAPRPRLSVAASRPQPTPPSLHAPSGGLLLAFRLAQRPPPFAS